MPDTTVDLTELANMMSWHFVTSEEFKTGTKIDDDIYFLSDTLEIYRGNVCFTKFIEMFEEAANIANPSQNRLYIKSSNMAGYIYDGTNFKMVIRPLASKIAEGDNGIVTSGVIFKYVKDQMEAAAAQTVKGVDFDEAEHMLTITMGDNTSKTITLTGLATNLTFANNTLTLTDASGEVIGDPIDLSTLSDVINVDGGSIVNDEGTLSLKNFGKEFYAYHDPDNILDVGNYSYPSNMPEGVENAYVKVGGAWYKYVNDAWNEVVDPPSYTSYYVKTVGWKSGLEPRVTGSAVIGYSIAWYEPSTTTIDGVSTAIATMQTKLDAMESRVDGNTTRIAAVETAINKLNGDATIEGSVEQKVQSAIATLTDNKPENIQAIKTLADWINEHGAEAAALTTDINANKAAIAALETLVGELPEGTQATDVFGYIQEAIDNITIDGTQFATAEQGKKADTAVQSVTSTGNGVISVDGVDVKVYEAIKATAEAFGIVKGDEITVQVVDGVISIKAVTTDMITGLNDTIASVVEATIQDKVDTNFVKTDDLSQDVNVDEPSASKAVSEAAIVKAMSWKTTM